MRANNFSTSSVKFILVGLSNTAVSYCSFVVVHDNGRGLDVFLSQIVGYGLGVLWSFFWNKNWTFAEKHHSWSVLPKFLLVQVLMMFLSAGLMLLADQITELNLSVIWFLTAGFITWLNFLILKFAVFR